MMLSKRIVTTLCFVLSVAVWVVACTPPTTPGKENPSGGGDGGTGTAAAPQITITEPVRGAMLTGKATVAIKGSVNLGPDQLSEFTVNGKTVAVNADGTFSSSMDAAWGVNLLTVKAVDKKGQEASRGQSFLWAREYRTIDETKMPKAAVARLGKKGIDDDERASLNDLASILEHVLNGLELDPLIPETLVEGEYKIPPIGPTVKYVVIKNGKVKLGRRQVTIKPRKDGLALYLKLKDVVFPVKGTAAKYLNKQADVLAPEISIYAEVDLRYANDQVIVDIIKFEVDASKVEVKAFSGLFSFLNKTLTNKIRDLLQTKLEAIVKTLLPGPVENFIRSFKFAKDFPLPELLGGKVLQFDSVLDSLVFDEKGGTIGLQASVVATQGIPDAKLGVPLVGQLAPKWSPDNFAFGVALSYNAVNMVLGTVWFSGALKQDVSSLLAGAGTELPLGATSMVVRVDAMLPPVVRSTGTIDKVEVGVGDLKLDLRLERGSADPIIATAYLSTVFEATVKITPQNEISIDLAPDPKNIVVDIVSIEGLGNVTSGELSQIIGGFAPKLTDLLSSGIIKNIPIPSIDLSTLAGTLGIPAGTVLTIQNGTSSLIGDYLKVTGDL